MYFFLEARHGQSQSQRLAAPPIAGQLKSPHGARTYRRTLGVVDWRGGGDLASASESLLVAKPHQICRFCEALSVLKQPIC